jgi:hypothetical protein
MRKSRIRKGRRTEGIIEVQETMRKSGMRKGRRTERMIGVEETMRKSRMRKGGRTVGIIGVEEKSGIRKGRITEGIIGVEEKMRKSGMRKGRRTHPPTGDQSWNAVELSVGDRRACVKTIWNFKLPNIGHSYGLYLQIFSKHSALIKYSVYRMGEKYGGNKMLMKANNESRISSQGYRSHLRRPFFVSCIQILDPEGQKSC